jgi:hypothetical protein
MAAYHKAPFELEYDISDAQAVLAGEAREEGWTPARIQHARRVAVLLHLWTRWDGVNPVPIDSREKVILFGAPVRVPGISEIISVISNYFYESAGLRDWIRKGNCLLSTYECGDVLAHRFIKGEIDAALEAVAKKQNLKSAGGFLIVCKFSDEGRCYRNKLVLFWYPYSVPSVYPFSEVKSTRFELGVKLLQDP